MTCSACGAIFAARSDAHYCSVRCRVAAHRTRRVADLPSALTARNRWVLHDVRKVPRQVSGALASSTNPATWGAFDVVSTGAHGRGLGFVLNGDGVCCIDLDHCITDGAIADWAADIVSAAGRTYVELSPSGTGLHIWGKALVGKGFRGNGVEVYDRGRYMTVTGRPWADAPLRVASVQRLVDALINRDDLVA